MIPPVTLIPDLVALAAAQRLQAAYEAGRKVHRAAFDALHAEGAFRAPEHLVPAVQRGLGLAGPLVPDPQRVEAG
jgi:hypothetical protein